MTVTTPAQRNGVDRDALFGTINLVGENPELGRFRFRASNRWVTGTHSRTTIDGFYGAGEERAHVQASTYDADHPQILVGADNGPTPVEFLLHAIATCLTAGIANVASARGIVLNSVESSVEGDIDLRAILGLTDEVRNGYQQVRVSFQIDADASDEDVRALVEQSTARSAVFDVLTNGVPVAVDVTAV
jgi:uncharacterized OsmC-like protein